MSYIRSYIEVHGEADEVSRFKKEYIANDVLKDDIDNLASLKSSRIYPSSTVTGSCWVRRK